MKILGKVHVWSLYFANVTKSVPEILILENELQKSLWNYNLAILVPWVKFGNLAELTLKLSVNNNFGPCCFSLNYKRTLGYLCDPLAKNKPPQI